MAIHKHILHNGKVRDARSAELRAGQVGLLSGWGVFSTLRIVAGVPFAWERHWARMSRDARLLNVEMPPDRDALEQDLRRLIEANGRQECTLRLAIIRNGGGMWEDPDSAEPHSDVVALTADSKKWSSTVRLGVEQNARFAGSEFVGAKILSWAQNLTWAERAQLQGLDEVVLLNQHGQVAECTSANIFAVFGNNIFTPPLSEGCLPGITREILLEIAQPASTGTTLAERALTMDELFRADEVFITSTTRDLLPVREIAGRSLQSNPAAREALSAAFAKFTAEDITHRKAVRVLV